MMSGCNQDRCLSVRSATLEPKKLLRRMSLPPPALSECSHSPPEGSLSVLVGRHGAMNPAGKVRGNMPPIAKAYSGASQPLFDCATHGHG